MDIRLAPTEVERRAGILIKLQNRKNLEVVTGTKVDKREGFQEMIRKCQDGEIDMILTKSISRFSRNTPDTIKYVRMLRDKNITIFFEKENINTLDMNGEMLLTILSSLAQQEVESLPGNVKVELQMKMKRGELSGFSGCLGYDYDKKTKTITVNKTEAETVQLIFELYIQVKKLEKEIFSIKKKKAS